MKLCPMKLSLLGTTGYHPNERAHTMCLLLPECGVMLDAGTGMFRAAQHLKGPELDIFVTHAHLDHIIGLTFLFDVIRHHPLDRVTVHGEATKLAAVEEHLFAESVFPARPPIEFRPLRGEVSLSGEGRLTHFPVEHPGGAVGYRLEWPSHSMAYVTDTTASLDAAYLEQIRGVDLLVHECYFPDQKADWAAKTGHSSITPVALLAKSAGVGRLVLVHMDPGTSDEDPVGLETARQIFPATELAYDLMQLDF